VFSTHQFNLPFSFFKSIAIRYPLGSAQCGGVKLLLNAILDANYSGIQESLVLALIYLLNEEETRKYVRSYLDIGMILAPITDNFGSKEPNPTLEKEKEKKWSASIKALTIMLRSWTGLIILSSHPLSLKTLVDAFKLPCTELHVTIDIKSSMLS
jgi:hypothetical protein